MLIFFNKKWTNYITNESIKYFYLIKFRFFLHTNSALLQTRHLYTFSVFFSSDYYNKFQKDLFHYFYNII